MQIMSGLDKFQNSESRCTNLKKLLLMERKPEIIQNTTITNSHRYSLDISDELKNIIEQKKNQKTVHFNSKETVNITNSTTETEKQSEENILEQDIIEKVNMNQRYDKPECGEIPMWQKAKPDESFEMLEKMCEKTISDPNSTLYKYLNGEAVQKSNNIHVWQKSSDESFEALERMCDKTASDPNSTLFKYLHTESREDILAEFKKRSTDGENSEDQLLSKINNCTLLEDIEAPSRMWENTICGAGGDNNLQTSPVKMVGLLRPSTIIEEAPDDESANSDISSQLSFHTATKSGQSDVSSSAYDTAYDSTVASNKTDFSNKVQNIILKQVATNQEMLIDLDQQESKTDSSFELTENTIVEPTTTMFYECNLKEGNDISIDLIDLEQTVGAIHCPPHSSLTDLIGSGNDGEEDVESSEDEKYLENKTTTYNVLNDSVIEIVSDDDDDNVEIIPQVDVYDYKIKSEITDINSVTYSFNESNDDNKENSLDKHVQAEKSMQFNDTMEEVEYLLTKGMEYMKAEAAATKKTPEKVEKILGPSNNMKEIKGQTNSPIKHLKTAKPLAYFSPSKAKTPTPTKKTTQTKAPSSSSKRFDIDIKPFPKLDIFAKPSDRNRTKELAAIKQQKFSHIISPIGTYMKKTAQTPLMSSINCKTKDYFNSTAIMELENESRLYTPQFETHYTECGGRGIITSLPGLSSDIKRPLPKKAYISSDLKHIVDERTPITIPASKQIQKYLENAMMPAVLRHEGKLKVPGINNKPNDSSSSLNASVTNLTSTKTKTSHIPPRNNASLANLSVMSGDVSMYTIMDAQKF